MPKIFWRDKSCRLLLLLVLMTSLLLVLLNFFGKQVNLVVNQKNYPVYTFKATIAQVIDEQNIKVNTMDLVTPQLTAAVKDGQIIRVIKVDKREKIVQHEVPFDVVWQADDRLSQGIEVVRQEGLNGLKNTVYSIVLHDGIEVSRDLVKTVVVKVPQPKIIAFGKRPAVPLVNRSLEGKRFVSESKLTAVATAYTFTGNNTATGITPYPGVVAVDPRVIPLGTRLYVEGYGEAVALDTGGGIQGNHLDLFFSTKEEAFNWGRRTVNVQILD